MYLLQSKVYSLKFSSFWVKMKIALVILVLVELIMVSATSGSVIFNDYLAGKRCPSPACDG